jgi:hypothetical protein
MIRSIRKFILLTFHPYKERPKQSLYVMSVIILVWIVLKSESALSNLIRIGLFVSLYQK